MTRPRQIGLPWYRPEHYAQFRALMADGERLPALYDVWRLSADQIAGEIERSGIKVVFVEIEPEPFVRWCAQHGLTPDGAARSRFANEVAEGAPLDGVADP
jgi:hypothetical protein